MNSKSIPAWQQHFLDNPNADYPCEDLLAASLIMHAATNGKVAHSSLMEFDSDHILGEKPFEEVVKFVESKGLVQFSITKRGPFKNDSKKFVNDESVVAMYLRNGNILVNTWSLDKDFIAEVKAFVEKAFPLNPDAGRNVINTLISTSRGPEIVELGTVGYKLIETNYNESVVTDFKHIAKDIESKKPCGRMMIFSGTPGSGKTNAIQSLTHEAQANFVMVSPGTLQALSGPSLINVLIEKRAENKLPIVLVIEDADECLTSRGADNMASLSALLNMSDGIMGSALNLFIVATTNAHTHELDEAVRRPGRLCRHVMVDALSFSRATECFRAIVKDPEATLPEERSYTLAELYRMSREDYDPTAPPVKTRRTVGFGT